MTGSVALDEYMAERMSLLAPHYDIYSTANPLTLKHNIGLPSVTVTNKAEWMAAEVMVI